MDCGSHGLHGLGRMEDSPLMPHSDPPRDAAAPSDPVRAGGGSRGFSRNPPPCLRSSIPDHAQVRRPRPASRPGVRLRRSRPPVTSPRWPIKNLFLAGPVCSPLRLRPSPVEHRIKDDEDCPTHAEHENTLPAALRRRLLHGLRPRHPAGDPGSPPTAGGHRPARPVPADPQGRDPSPGRPRARLRTDCLDRGGLPRRLVPGVDRIPALGSSRSCPSAWRATIACWPAPEVVDDNPRDGPSPAPIAGAATS